MLHLTGHVRIRMNNTRLKMSARPPVWMIALLMLVGGCGFHLRTYDVDAAFENYFVVANESSPFAGDLRRILNSAGVAESPSRSAADVVIEVLDERDLQRAVSTTGNARVAEYELEQAVYIRITDGAGAELSAPQWINRSRVYRVDRDNLTSNSEEQALITRELRAELSQALLRAVNAVARNKNAKSASITTDAG